MHLAQISAAMHCHWVTEHLYGQQVYIGIFAMTQACCRPVLQSSTEQWGMHFATSNAAMQWWWVTAHLYEQQILIGVFT